MQIGLRLKFLLRTKSVIFIEVTHCNMLRKTSYYAMHCYTVLTHCNVPGLTSYYVMHSYTVLP